MKENYLAAVKPTQPIHAPSFRNNWPAHHQISVNGENEDHFVERNGVLFAGTHLIVDLWGAKHLDDLNIMESALRECVHKCRATLLHIHLHHFLPNGGISGVAVLAESHISVHTWPERDFAAFDIFMCGDARPEEAISVLQHAFSPTDMHINENLRGVVSNA